MILTGTRIRVVSQIMGIAIAALTLTSFSTKFAQAQGFSVSPVRVEADVPGGRGIEIPFELSNSTETQVFEMTVTHVELLQAKDGSWLFEETDELFDPERHNSNRTWFSNANQTITVGPQQSTNIVLEGEVPRDARGTSLSALLVTSNAQGDENDPVRLQFQFLVPVILTISGRPARQDISLVDLGLELINPLASVDPDSPWRALGLANMVNAGETYSRIAGNIRVELQEDDSWRLVTTADIPDRGIIPGAELALEAELGRSLPSGNYRLTGNVEVDGRRLPRVVSEFEFEGDAALDSIAYDTSIIVEPGIAEVAVRAGASRTQALKLTNPSDSTVEVTLSPEVPAEIASVMIGDVMGTEMSAANWLTMRPAKVMLRPNSSRNVRLIASLPEEAPVHPYYYSNIVVEGTYQDGQTAGTSRAKVVLERDADAAVPQVVLETLSYASVGNGQHAIRARVVNVGNLHTGLSQRAQLISEDGDIVVPITLDGGEDLMLPFSVWDFAGVVDVSLLEDGEYILRASFDYVGNNRATQDLNVSISTGDDGVKVISASEE